MSNDAPDPPDYTPIAAASAEAAEIQAAIALEQLDWTKQQWADQKLAIEEVMDVMLPQMREQWTNAQEDRARYEQLYQPIEEAYLEKAAGWDTPERRAAKAAQAQSEISQQFDAQRKNALQRLESYGIDPSQTRNSALDLGVRVEQAKAMAQGSQAARDQVEREGMGYQAELTNVGRGLPAQGLQYASSSQGASTQAQGASGAWQGASAAMGSPTDWYAGSDRSLGTWGTALTGGYNAQLGAYQADQMNNPMNLLATAGGAALGTFLADGGQVVGPGGPKDDMIPVNLSDNEYVIPEEVVRRKGTEFFDKLIEKTHKDLAVREQAAQVTPTGVAIPPPTSMSPQGGQALGGAPGMAAGGGVSKVINTIKDIAVAGERSTPRGRLNELMGISQSKRTTGIPLRDASETAWRGEFPEAQNRVLKNLQPTSPPPYEIWKQNVQQYNRELAAAAPAQVTYDPEGKSNAMQWLAYRRATRMQEELNDSDITPPGYVPLTRKTSGEVYRAQKYDKNPLKTPADWRAIGSSQDRYSGGWEGDDADRAAAAAAVAPRYASKDSLKAPMPKKTAGVEYHDERMNNLRRRIRALRSVINPNAAPSLSKITPAGGFVKEYVGMTTSKPVGMSDEEYLATRGGPTLGELYAARPGYAEQLAATKAERAANAARVAEVGWDQYVAEKRAAAPTTPAPPSTEGLTEALAAKGMAALPVGDDPKSWLKTI